MIIGLSPSKINKIDFSAIDELVLVADMKWVRPFGMLLTAMAIKELRRSDPHIPFMLQCDANRKGIPYAGHMGFFKAISHSINIGNAPGEASGNMG